MAATGGRSTDRLIDSLERDPRRFSFHEAVRLIERWALHRSGMGQLGTQAAPDREPVRFEGDQSVSFPGSEIAGLEPPTDRNAGMPYRMKISFIGLTGPLGVLPDFYTDLIIQRQRLGDRAFAHFLDIFLHRVASLHYRAWKKYRLGPTIEQSFRGRGEDAITTLIRSVIGYGLPSMMNRMSVSDSVLLRYAGHLSAGSRSAPRLRRVLEDHLGVSCEVDQFQGTWRYLPDEDRTRLPSTIQPEGSYARLGTTALLGRRVWDATGSFRVRLGPMSRRQYERFLPGRPDARQLADLVRAFSGPSLNFDVALLVRRGDLPAAVLIGPEVESSHLGWNAWLGGGVGSDLAESIFSLEALRGHARL